MQMYLFTVDGLAERSAREGLAVPDAVARARRLIAEHGVKGFKFHPNLQAFFPNDRSAYPLYEAIAEAGLPALFHSGHSGIGTGVAPEKRIALS